MNSNLRKKINFWGAILFGGLFAFGALSTAYEKLSNSSKEDSKSGVHAEEVETNQGPSHSQASEHDALIDRCIRSAVGNGYIDGQCAHGYIDACVRTQSKSEMDKALAIDRMVGMVGDRGCTNMPTTYVQQFNYFAKAQDRF